MTKTTRVLEPEVMDTVDEALTYDEMDHADVNRRFVDDLLRSPIPAGEFLDLGTGTGRIPIELCQRNPQFRILAIDMAVSMLDVARNHVEIAHLSHQIQLDRADVKQLPYANGRFALVMSNSILHHLPEPARAIREAIRVARPEARFFFRDLLRPATTKEIEELVGTYAEHESPHGRQLFRASLHAALNLEEIRALVMAHGFPADSVVSSSDRHWTWDARRSQQLQLQ